LRPKVHITTREVALIDTHFDDRLRERADDEEELREALAAERGRLESAREQARAEPSERFRADVGRSLMRLSEYEKLADMLDEALAHRDEAIAMWAALDRQVARFNARMHRAWLLHLLGRDEEAEHRFTDLQAELGVDERFAPYRDFLFELRGRFLCRIGSLEEGRADLEGALAIRRDRGSEPAVARTEALIERCEKL
jgi:tetratricopeptide (TPR) repeat protein